MTIVSRLRVLLTWGSTLLVAVCAWGQQHVDSLKLPEVIVSGMTGRNVQSTDMGHVNLSGETILHLPSLFGEGDVVKALHTLPGVSQGVEGFSGLYVHGGEGDQNVFLYQGLPLYHVGHLGGVFSAFNAATVDNIDFYKAAYPARYGGFVSSVVDIKMKRPDFEKTAGSFTVGLLTGNVCLTTPVVKDRLAVVVGVRRSLIDLFTIPVLAIINASKKKDGEKKIGYYAFADANARIDWKASAALRMSLVGYYGHDRFKLGEKDFDAPNLGYTWVDGKLVPDNTEGMLHYYDQSTSSLSWGNVGTALNAHLTLGTLHLTALGAFTRYSSHYDQRHEAQSDLANAGTYAFNLYGTRNTVADFMGMLMAYVPVAPFYTLEAGLTGTHHRFMPERITHKARQGSQPIEGQQGANEIVNVGEVSLYADNNIDLGPVVKLNLGGRVTKWMVQKGRHRLAFEPRLAARVMLAREVSLKCSYTVMHQAVQQVSTNYVNLPTDLWLPTIAVAPPLKCRQLSAGVFCNMAHGTSASVELWYKRLWNLVEYREGVSVFNTSLIWREKTTLGRGWCYGLDVSAFHRLGKVEGTLGYGLMWNYRKFDRLNKGRRFPAKFDNRHKIDLTLTYHRSEKIDFSASWTYMTGNRITLSVYNYDIYGSLFPDAPHTIPPFVEETGVDYYASRNNYRLPAFHRLNLGMTLKHKRRNGHMSMWNFSLYNAYWRQNAITIKKDDDNGVLFTSASDWHRAFKAVSIIPIMPSVSYTYEF